MIFSDVNVRMAYNEYIKKYNSSRKFAISRGVYVRKSTENVQYPLSYDKFRIDYITAKLEAPKSSWRKVAQTMAKNDVYPVTSRQAINYARAHEVVFGEAGVNVVQQYRFGFTPTRTINGKEVDIFSEIETRRAQLFKEKKSKSDVWKTIAKDYFGRDY